MKGKCALSDCGVGDGLSCEEGHLDINKCPHHSSIEGSASVIQPTMVDDEGGQRLPWSGRALGLSDMMLATARSSCVLVGLVGAFNAGKTAFLTSLFVHLAKTGMIDLHSFAGSYTLQAWTRLRQYTAWPTNYGPSFPPHTPDSAERVPSLLHLAFRNADSAVQDVLFTDAPGEWFSRWIQNQTSDNACGARWISDHATHLLFFVDREALAGPAVGKVRQDTLGLARILSEHRKGRPLIVVWTKSDCKFDVNVEEPIRERFHKFFGEHLSLDLHAGDPSCLKVLESLLATPKLVPISIKQTVFHTNSAFLAYKGISE